MRIDGPKGNTKAYDAGYEYSFRLTDNGRRIVDALRARGVSMDEALRVANVACNLVMDEDQFERLIQTLEIKPT